MTYPAYLREKALELRVERQLSVNEIANRLALPKTTVYYWVQDVPLQRPRSTAGQRRMSRSSWNFVTAVRGELSHAGVSAFSLVGV